MIREIEDDCNKESWIDPRAWRDRLERLDRLGPAGAYWLSPLRGRSPSPLPRAGSVPPMPLRASSLPPRRSYTPPPEAPSEKQVAFNYAGQPIYTRGGITRRPLSELLEPLTSLPMSRITRDPWWWEYPELRPYVSPWSLPSHAPFYLRDSYLSPVKRSYLWSKHPIRPFAHYGAVEKAHDAVLSKAPYGALPKAHYDDEWPKAHYSALTIAPNDVSLKEHHNVLLIA
ncbi:Putative myofilin isoform a [Gryllus bimaculatus]|nr:Putative myofilin isoform a [Gryllus bimaculatus]